MHENEPLIPNHVHSCAANRSWVDRQHYLHFERVYIHLTYRRHLPEKQRHLRLDLQRVWPGQDYQGMLAAVLENRWWQR
jgi:hypothetical protein